jgi:hypothetical protein
VHALPHIESPTSFTSLTYPVFPFLQGRAVDDFRFIFSYAD